MYLLNLRANLSHSYYFPLPLSFPLPLTLNILYVHLKVWLRHTHKSRLRRKINHSVLSLLAHDCSCSIQIMNAHSLIQPHSLSCYVFVTDVLVYLWIEYIQNKSLLCTSINYNATVQPFQKQYIYQRLQFLDPKRRHIPVIIFKNTCSCQFCFITQLGHSHIFSKS